MTRPDLLVAEAVFIGAALYCIWTGAPWWGATLVGLGVAWWYVTK